MTKDQILESQALVERVFRSLRDDLLEVFGKVEFSRKDNASPVTEWDVKVENTLREALASEMPTLGFEGEETGVHGDRSTYWLVDPIDGTSSFIRGLHYSTNMAALVHEGQAIAAVIYDFIHDNVYTAIKGEGAFKNGEKISVNVHRREGDLLVYSFSREKFELIREALAQLGTRTILPMGAAGHTYALLAEGKIDGAVAIGTAMGVYDNAPGILLAEEAGAVMFQLDDAAGVERHEFIIGTPYLIELIEKSGLI